MLPNVKKVTIEPFIKKHVAPQSQVYTDEYNIYDDLESWGFRHKTVCHGKGEYASDDDKGGIYEVHVNTMEGFCSLLRSLLRPHRGIYQEALALYLGFLSFCIMLAEEVKACFSPWSTCWLHSGPEYEKRLRRNVRLDLNSCNLAQCQRYFH